MGSLSAHQCCRDFDPSAIDLCRVSAPRRPEKAGCRPLLSGGKQQMLAIGRALDVAAATIMFDEPSSD